MSGQPKDIAITITFRRQNYAIILVRNVSRRSSFRRTNSRKKEVDRENGTTEMLNNEAMLQSGDPSKVFFSETIRHVKEEMDSVKI